LAKEIHTLEHEVVAAIFNHFRTTVAQTSRLKVEEQRRNENRNGENV